MQHVLSGCWTHLRFGEGTRGLSGLFGGKLPGLPFPGGGTGFLGGTTGAAGFVGLLSGVGLSTEMERKRLRGNAKRRRWLREMIAGVRKETEHGRKDHLDT